MKKKYINVEKVKHCEYFMDLLHHSIFTKAIFLVKQGGVTLDSDEQGWLNKHYQDLCE